MFMSNKISSSEVVRVILEELKKRHVRHTAKKSNIKTEQIQPKLCDPKMRHRGRVFGVPLDGVHVSLLECCEGHFYIPSIIADLIVALKPYVTVEGMFRKVGSVQRQKDMKLTINKTGYLGDVPFPAIDMAGLLKSFLRDIPESLIRTDVCDTLYKCKILSVADMLETIQLCVLLLPVAHIHLLHILLEFLHFVSSHHTLNRMDTNNLAIVMTPSVFSPSAIRSEARCGHFIKLLEIMIENSNTIGKIPNCVWDKISGTPTIEKVRTDVIANTDNENKLQKKKRRSSFSSVIAAGLRKIRRASYGDPTEAPPTDIKTSISTLVPLPEPDLPQKLEGAQSRNAPPRLLLSSLRKSVHTTPVILSKKRKFDTHPTPGFSSKTRQNVINSLPSSSLATPTPIKRSRTIPPNPNVRRNIVNVENEQPATSQEILTDRSKDDLLVINKKLMRDVAFLEKRLNRLENFVAYQISGEAPANVVQDAYEKTLEEAAMIDTSSSQQLTDRLSKELKLRQEKTRPKVIRSPSARKIGTIRRRSRDSCGTDFAKHNLARSDEF